MKKLLLSAAAFIALIGSAQAQDWSGLYVGAQLGQGQRDTTWTDLDGDWVTPGAVADTSDSDGIVAGGSVGFNWQWGNFVLGAQGDVSYTDLSSTTVGDQCTCVSIENDMNYLVTARGNFGYALGAWLPYATVGYAFTDLEHSWIEAGDPPDLWVGVSNDNAMMYGVGVRYAIGPQWSFGGEVLRYDFDLFTATNPTSFDMDIEHELDIFQLTAQFQF